MTELVVEVTGERGKVDRDHIFEYVREFIVITDNPLLRSPDILALAEIPLPFEPHPGDVRALAVDPEARQDGDNPHWWEVTVSYSSKIEKKEDKNPLNRPAKIAIRTENFTRITTVDFAGNPLTNTAGDLLEGIERDDSRLTISVTKNVGNVPRWIDRYNDAINSDAIRIKGRPWKARTLKFQNLLIPDQVTENDITFMPLSFELHHRQEGWDEQFPNRGFNELVTDIIKDKDPTSSRFGDVIGKRPRLQKILVGKPPEPPSEPVWLDADGKAFRNEDGSVRPPKPEELIVLNVQHYRPLPFSVLPLK